MQKLLVFSRDAPRTQLLDAANPAQTTLKAVREPAHPKLQELRAASPSHGGVARNRGAVKCAPPQKHVRRQAI